MERQARKNTEYSKVGGMHSQPKTWESAGLDRREHWSPGVKRGEQMVVLTFLVDVIVSRDL